MKVNIRNITVTFLIATMILLNGCSANTSNKETTLTSLLDLTTDSVSLIALGNDDVPVGRYAKEALVNYGIWDEIESKISYASSVKEVLSQVELGSVSCGIVYATDAITSDGVCVVETIDSSLLESPVIYPAAIMNDSVNQEAVQCFMDYLTTATAIATFEENGFTYLPEESIEQEVELEACTITIFAAASLMESISEISNMFMEEHEGVEIIASFDSSGTLSSQIQYGAITDIFISASTSEVETLEELGYIDEDNVYELLSNELVLITAK